MKRIVEVIIVTVLLIVATRWLYVSQNIPFVGKYYSTMFAVIFLYVPMMVIWMHKEPMDFLDSSLSTFIKGVLTFIVAAVIVFPIFIFCAHYWETWVYGRQGFHLVPFPDFLKTAVFQILLIALPEEFYFRGYMQTSLDKVFRARWRILGVNLGWAWPLTAIIFAFSHSFIHFQWWHFSIFFPALLFGWLRARTGSITASVFFHAASNIISDWIARSYT